MENERKSDEELLAEFGARIENGIVKPLHGESFATEETKRFLEGYKMIETGIQKAASDSPASLIKEVQKTIDKNGYWQETEEWRISTLTIARIERVKDADQQWYQVSVKCGVEFKCRCSTVARAVQFCSVFKTLMPLVVYGIGWPSDNENRFR